MTEREGASSCGASVSTQIRQWVSRSNFADSEDRTGKTRLVRAILAVMSARKADSAQVLYTADARALENDEIFVDFLTGNHRRS
jgi:hypothetical protein